MKTLYILLASFFLYSAGVQAQVGAQETPAQCITGDAVAKNIVYKVNGKKVNTLAGNVKEGNMVEVTFTTSPGTSKTRFSLVAYNAPGKNVTAQNISELEAFDYETEEVGPGTHTFHVTVPNNYFQVEFVKGCVIWKFDANSNYGARSMAKANGGEKDCCKKCDENKKVTICHVPKGNPANAHTITVAKAAAKAHIGRHGGDYYGECKTNPGDTTSTVNVDVECESVTVTSTNTKIKFITLMFDDSSTQTFEINAKTAMVSPINEYEGYFIYGAYVKVAQDGTGAQGQFYLNEGFAECEEPVDPALPVTMSKFEATKIEPSVVKLEWTTTSETNSDYIAIEKSSDIENWKEVCRVPSAAPGGNSQHVHDYTCMDNHADEDGQNIVYYRPKQVDLNGTFEYHTTIRVRLQDAAYATEIQSVYPNPAADRLNIKYNTAENGIFNIKLMSLDGKSLLQNQYVAKPGVQTLDLDLMEDKLSPGVYVLEIQTEKEVFRQKVYKQ